MRSSALRLYALALRDQLVASYVSELVGIGMLEARARTFNHLRMLLYENRMRVA